MAIEFKPAKRENVSLLIGLVSGTGGGKTFTAMRLASGMAGGKRFCVIDTEAGRAKHYADQFKFDHGDLAPPFRPESYTEAIHAADKAGYPVIVVDSMSHVWAGDGGVLDWQEEELERMAGQDWKKRESCKMAAWIRPKMAHKKMVQSLLQVRAHLILCFRAEPKVEMVKENGKTVIQAKHSLVGLDGWIPVCDKNLPFELTTSILFTADRPGIPQPIKLQEQHKGLFPLGEQVSEKTGNGIARWAAGGAPTQPKAANLADVLAAINAATTPDALKDAGAMASKLTIESDVAEARAAYKARNEVLKKPASALPSEPTGLITVDQKTVLSDALDGDADITDALLTEFGCSSLATLPAAKYESAKAWLADKC